MYGKDRGQESEDWIHLAHGRNQEAPVNHDNKPPVSIKHQEYHAQLSNN
jgi:hypothetical protein